MPVYGLWWTQRKRVRYAPPSIAFFHGAKQRRDIVCWKSEKCTARLCWKGRVLRSNETKAKSLAPPHGPKDVIARRNQNGI
jgi:hypothetical protein